MASSRFFPDSDQDKDPRNEGLYKVKPGDIKPLFDKGALTFNVESDGTTYIRITDKGYETIRRVNK